MLGRTPDTEELLEHLGFVRSLALAMVNDASVAEDVAQDTMLDAIQRPPKLRSGLREWLSGVVRNKIKTHYRSESRRSKREHRAGLQFYQDRPEDLANDTLQRAELQQKLVDAVLTLPEPIRLTLLLRYMQGLSPTEIARVTSVPLPTVKTRLRRGLERLRTHFDQTHGGRRCWTAAFLVFGSSPTTLPHLPGPVATKTASAASLWLGLFAVTLAVLVTVALQSRSLKHAKPKQTASQAANSSDVDSSSGHSPGPPPSFTPDGSTETEATGTARSDAKLVLTVVGPDGDALEGAIVTHKSNAQTLATNSSGQTLVELVPPSRRIEKGETKAGPLTLLRIEHAGFASRTIGVPPNRTAIEVALSVSQRICVEVVEATTGSPVAGARVRAHSNLHVESPPESVEVDSASSGLDTNLDFETIWDMFAESVAAYGEVDCETEAPFIEMPDTAGDLITDADGHAFLDVPLNSFVHFECEARGFATLSTMEVAADGWVELSLHPGCRLNVKRDGFSPGEALTLFLTGGGYVEQTMSADQEEALFDTLPAGEYRVTALVGTAPSEPAEVQGSAYCSYQKLSWMWGGPHAEANSSREGAAGTLRGRVQFRTVTVTSTGESSISLGNSEVSFEVRVRGESRRSNLEAELVLRSLHDEIVAVANYTDPNYLFRSVEPGTYQLEALQADGTAIRQPATVLPGMAPVSVQIGDAALSIHTEALSPLGPLTDSWPSAEVPGPFGRVIVVHRATGNCRRVALGSGGELRIGGLLTGLTQVWVAHDSTLHYREFDLRPGERSWHPARKHDPTVQLQITVVDENQRPVKAWVDAAPVEVPLKARGGTVLSNFRFDLPAEGSHGSSRHRYQPQWEVPTGRYRVTVRTPNASPSTHEIDVRAHHSEKIELRRVEPIRLTILRDGDTAARERFHLFPDEPHSWWQTAIMTNDAGQATLRLNPGAYTLCSKEGAPARFKIAANQRAILIELANPDSGDSLRSNRP